MADDAKKSMNAGAQAVAAVVVVGGVLGGMWALGEAGGNTATDGPAVCSASHTRLPAKYVSGAQLCKALNRPDLPMLLGTPAEQAETASGGGGWTTLAGGTKIATPDATVKLKTYSVQLSASYDHLPVAQMADLLGTRAEKKTVLGHPAVLYSDQTISLTFDGSKLGTGPGGGIARCLMVARDVKDGGGSFEVAIWRQDAVPPDDAALFRIAEEALPRIPGWTAG